MYGETQRAVWLLSLGQGLSPHVRGNRGRGQAFGRRGGSIPACTGKPGNIGSGYRTLGVYPRMYGETPRKSKRVQDALGLSPHVRGNLPAAMDRSVGAGSIPACTGKPYPRARARTCEEVYPRMYGETPANTPPRSGGPGLSPHVRGNRQRGASTKSCIWSIPACTGKPTRYIA